jgi:ABC-type anion transport system duplicated permease subunit
MPKNNLLYTSLTPSLFIKPGAVMYICVRRIYLSTIFLLNVGTGPTVWYFFLHFIIGCEKKPNDDDVRLTSPNSWVEIAII